MSRKLDDFMGGIDELPSGNMEKGEDIYTALAREVKEETNLDLKNVICFINSFDYISGSGKKARQYNFAITVEKEGDIKLTEHDAYKWETLQSAMENSKITDEVKECLRYIALIIYQENQILNVIFVLQLVLLISKKIRYFLFTTKN